ncbi:MAG TPA: serine/threonine-protein kinase [Thermoanaerobaculia bacterium]|nr:serine/threonine-protein kinase [Thermoanaerobaculia bacterium]
MPPEPNQIGRYRIQRELGRGGMGVVYLALDPELDRTVAIKRIQLPPAVDERQRDELARRFRREAKSAARIRHPGVVVIHDVGRIGGDLFLVMELVEGESLADRIRRGAFPSRREALELTASAAEALGAAHRAGVVHRDVKPANILLGDDGRVLLTDFGVARSLDEGSDLTRTGMVVGSPAYMAPEQLRGEPVGGRADLFSLGVVLYELLLRKRPFPSDSITTLLYQILHEDPLADPQIARELDAGTEGLLRSLLAKDPAARPRDAAAVAASLRALSATLPAGTAAAGTGASGAATQPLVEQRRGSRALLLATLAVTSIAVLGLFALRQGRPQRPSLAERPPAGAGHWQPGEIAAPPPLPVPESPPPAAEEQWEVVEEPPAPPPTPVPVVETAPPRAPAPRPEPEPAVEAPAPEPVAATPLPPPPPARPTPVQILIVRRAIELDIDPEEAEVYLDDRYLGIAEDLEDDPIVLPEGVHHLRFTHPGYRDAWVEVRVSPDARRAKDEVEVDLDEIDD